AINDAIRVGKPVVTANTQAMAELELDCIVEGTGVPEVGAEVAYRCIQGGKHIIMLNVEADVVIGPILHQMAQRAGVVYSVSSGDEPGLITELVDRWGGLGFEIVAVGKTPASLGKMDLYCTPESLAEEAAQLKVNPHFLVTFRDATKTAIEMSCIANATGLIPDVRGMHGPQSGIYEMATFFRLKSEGGILNNRGVVDYARPLKHPDGSIDYLRSVTPGVFIVVRTTHPQIQQDLGYFDVVHTGEYFTFHTPYHLVTNEIPLSIVWAVEDGEPTVVPYHGLVAEVLGAAKADLAPGTTLDGGGGFTLYGVNDLACVAKHAGCVPLGLLDGATLLKPVKRDQVITSDMVQLKTDSLLYHLRQMQETVLPPPEISRN
ncbi:MAG TPA: SAF domain-containing protein, partial [Candidatus Baltobacteraceae bacterium]|nr:SAF domain-containing protein [Candidatus Baltobacteraceae bacterium]